MKKVRLKGRSFWEVSHCRQASWIWNYLLDQRELARNYIHVRIGDGRSASM